VYSGIGRHAHLAISNHGYEY